MLTSLLFPVLLALAVQISDQGVCNAQGPARLPRAISVEDDVLCDEANEFHWKCARHYFNETLRLNKEVKTCEVELKEIKEGLESETEGDKQVKACEKQTSEKVSSLQSQILSCQDMIQGLLEEIEEASGLQFELDVCDKDVFVCFQKHKSEADRLRSCLGRAQRLMPVLQESGNAVGQHLEWVSREQESGVCFQELKDTFKKMSKFNSQLVSCRGNLLDHVQKLEKTIVQKNLEAQIQFKFIETVLA